MPSFLEWVNNMSPPARIMKNVVVVSAAFMVQFTAFQSMAALQSSINKVRGSTLTVTTSARILSV